MSADDTNLTIRHPTLNRYNPKRNYLRLFLAVGAIIDEHLQRIVKLDDNFDRINFETGVSLLDWYVQGDL